VNTEKTFNEIKTEFKNLTSDIDKKEYLQLKWAELYAQLYQEFSTELKEEIAELTK
jgi:hypothetical protein